MNKLVPTVTLTLKNVSSEPVANVQLNAVIRRVGETEEWGGAFQKVVGTEAIPPGGTHQTYRAAVEPRIHWHRTARADAEEQPVRRRSRPGVRQARRQSVDEARRVANRARDAHSVALRAFADTHISRTAARSVRRRRHHRRQRHRRRHPLYTAAGRGRRCRIPFWFLGTWLAGGALAFCGRDGVRRAGGAAAARRRRIRLSARGVRAARRRS